LGSIGAIAKELQKGRWLCSPCHVKETEEEQKKCFSSSTVAVRYRMKYHALHDTVVWPEKQLRSSCADCGEKVTYDTRRAFHFDHRPGETKLMHISAMVSRRKKPEVIKAEMAKCDLRCAACHMKITRLRQTKFDE